MRGQKVFIVKRYMSDDAKTIGNNTKLENIAKWIVNTFLDNFSKVVFPVLYRSLISEGRMYSVMIIPVHIIP